MTVTPTPPPPPPPPTGPGTTSGTYAPAPGAAPPPQKSSGCGKIALIGCSIIIVLGIAFVAVVVLVVFGAIKRTDIYKEARDRAASDPRVIAALGSPVETGIWVSGKVSVDSGTGVADITFPISGPKGKGKVHAIASRDERTWTYTRLIVYPDSGGQIDVLNPSQAAPTP